MMRRALPAGPTVRRQPPRTRPALPHAKSRLAYSYRPHCNSVSLFSPLFCPPYRILRQAMQEHLKAMVSKIFPHEAGGSSGPVRAASATCGACGVTLGALKRAARGGFTCISDGFPFLPYKSA